MEPLERNRSTTLGFNLAGVCMNCECLTERTTTGWWRRDKAQIMRRVQTRSASTSVKVNAAILFTDEHSSYKPQGDQGRDLRRLNIVFMFEHVKNALTSRKFKFDACGRRLRIVIVSSTPTRSTTPRIRCSRSSRTLTRPRREVAPSPPRQPLPSSSARSPYDRQDREMSGDGARSPRR